MYIKNILFLLTLLLLSACDYKGPIAKGEDSSMIKKGQKLILDQLIGVWKNEDGKGYERWSKYDDSTYFSSGFQINGNDTIYTERVQVYNKNGQWASENTVMEQNDGKAVQFMITDMTNDELHFNNPSHDFPTDIHYKLVDENTISAFISGPNQNGGIDTIPYNFFRIRN